VEGLLDPLELVTDFREIKQDLRRLHDRLSNMILIQVGILATMVAVLVANLLS
jgi:hypothetical protein